jgi:hypothetical protein
MKLKSFCTTKEMIWRGCPQNGRKSLLAIHLPIYSESIGSSKNKTPKKLMTQ